MEVFLMSNRLRFYIPALFLLLLSLSGCGIVFSYRYQQIYVYSNVLGASILIDDQKVCETPCVTTVPRQSDPIRAVMQKAGYEPVVFHLTSGTNPIAALNVLGTTIPGATFTTADMFFGSWYQFSPDSYYVPMFTRRSTDEERIELELQRKIFIYAVDHYQHLAQEEAKGFVGEYTYNLAEFSGMPAEMIFQMIRQTERPGAFASDLVTRRQQRLDDKKKAEEEAARAAAAMPQMTTPAR